MIGVIPTTTSPITALFCLFHIALLLNAPYIIEPFPGRSNRVLAQLDNITICGRVIGVLKCFAVFLPMAGRRPFPLYDFFIPLASASAFGYTTLAIKPISNNFAGFRIDCLNFQRICKAYSGIFPYLHQKRLSSL